jgi:uncharacterized protein YbjT (DUF2867 family)
MPLKSTSRRVLLLGGSGFVGRNLAALLRKQGYTIRVPTRDRQRSRDLLVMPEVELIAADVHDEPTLTRLLHGCSAAINLVGILNERGHDGSGFEHVHVALAQKLTRACRRVGVPRLLQMSALKADAERGPSHYLRSKGRAERVIASESGGEVLYTIFRPSVIFGPEDSFINRFARLLRLLPLLPLPRAGARFAPVFVDDVAAAFAAALADPRTASSTYELCGPDILTLEEIVRFVRGLLGVRRPIIPLPDALGNAQAWVGEYLLPGKPLSIDNFKSLGVASVCGGNPPPFALQPQSMLAVVPTYLGPESSEQQLARLRQSARRD